MKKQLRNVMLAGAATLLAGNAWAQGSTAVTEGENATLTIEWEQALPSDWIISTGRYGTAVKGSNEILVMNSVTNELWSFDANGSSAVMTGIANTPFAVTCDEAGNIIYNKGGGATAGATDFFVLPAGSRDINDVQALNLTLPEGLEAGRVDQLGRVLGNVLSSDGGWLTTAMNTQGAVSSYYIADGEVIDAYASLALPAAINTFMISQPWGTSVEECQNVSDPSMAVYVFQGNSGTFYGPNEDFDDWTAYSRVNQRSASGFDWFMLGDETYFVYGTKLEGRAATWCPGDFSIVRASDNAIVASYQAPIDTPSGAATGSIICYANEDGKSATIYRYSSVSGAAKLTFSIGGEVPPTPSPLYAVGAWCGWNPSAPSEFTYENSVYTITLGSKDDESSWVGEFKMSTTKGETASDWAGFEAGVICVADDQKIEENSKEYPLAIGGNANIAFGWPSEWTVTVNLETKTISAVAATEKPIVQVGDPLYITGANGSFDAVNPAEFTYDAAKDIYTYDLVNPVYGFKISTAKGTWDAFDGAGFHIDGNLTPNVVTTLLEGKPSGNINIVPNGDYTIVVDLTNMTIEAQGSAVVTSPDQFFVIGNLAVGDWNPGMGVELTKNGNIFEGDAEMTGGYFSFTEKLSPVSGDWNQIGQRYGAAANDQETHLNSPLPFQKGENAFNIWDYSEYPQNVHFVVDFENMTVTISTATGVEDIAIDAAAPAEYYNLQGIRVAQPESGKLYIVKQGEKVSKMLVK